MSKKTTNYAQLVALLIPFDKIRLPQTPLFLTKTLESVLLESRLVMTQVADDAAVTPTETGPYLIACPSFQLRFPNLSQSDMSSQTILCGRKLPSVSWMLDSTPDLKLLAAIGTVLPDAMTKMPADIARWSLGGNIVTRWGWGERKKNTILTLYKNLGMGIALTP